MRRRGWGSVVRRKRRDGSWYEGYWIRFRDERGVRTHRRAGDTLQAAENLLAWLREDVTAKREGRLRHLRVADFVLEYEPVLRSRLQPSTLESKLQHLEVAAAHFGDQVMNTVTRPQVEDWFAKLLNGGRSVGTVRNYSSTLYGLFRAAIERGAAETNPCEGVRLPEADPVEFRYLEPEELDRLYDRCAPWLRPLLVFLGETGCRVNEALALEWFDVAQGFARVHVWRSKPGATRTKNGEPRHVPLTPRARGVLEELHARRGPVPMEGRDPVFRIAYTPKLHYGFHLARERAGLPHFTLHALRKSFASSLVRAGVPIPAAAQVTGHKSLELFLKVYGRVAPRNAAEQAVEALAKARGQLPAASPPAPTEARSTPPSTHAG